MQNICSYVTRVMLLLQKSITIIKVAFAACSNHTWPKDHSRVWPCAAARNFTL